MPDLHVMYTPTCHLDPVNSTPIWNYLAAAQHMPFLCPHITGLTSSACVQKSFQITRFSFSYVLHSRAVKHLTLLQIPLFVPLWCFFSFKVNFTVSLRAVFHSMYRSATEDWKATSSPFLLLDFPFLLPWVPQPFALGTWRECCRVFGSRCCCWPPCFLIILAFNNSWLA